MTYAAVNFLWFAEGGWLWTGALCFLQLADPLFQGYQVLQQVTDYLCLT